MLAQKDNLILAIANSPSLALDIEVSVNKIKTELELVEKQISESNNIDHEFNAFVDFSLNYVDDLNANWWDLTPDRRERCKQLTFNDCILIDKNKRVSTPNISAIYRYKGRKKEPVKALVTMPGGPGGT